MSLFLLFSILLVLVPPASAREHLAVQWHGESLSVTAEGVPLSQVLQEVARRSGIEVRGLEELQDGVTVRFSRIPLREALAKLLAHMNYVLLLDGTAPQGGTRPAVVVIFGRRGPSPMQPMVARGVATTAENKPAGETQEEDRLRALHASAVEGNEGALRKALSDPDPAVQAMALDLLAANNRQEAIPLLVDGTKSKEPQMRLRALDLLSNSQADEQTVMSALGRAVADVDTGVKGYAIRALAERGGPDAIEHLRQALRDSDPNIRMLAIDNIVRSVPPAQRAPLLQQAAADSNEMVRSAASTWLEEGTEK